MEIRVMAEQVQNFVARRDATNTWVLESQNGRIHARSRYKDTLLELARRIARQRAPSRLYLVSGSGEQTLLSIYRFPRKQPPKREPPQLSSTTRS